MFCSVWSKDDIKFHQPDTMILLVLHINRNAVAVLLGCSTGGIVSDLSRLSYMLHHLRRLIQISCWCILPIQYELILIIVRFNVFYNNGWRIWNLTSKLTKEEEECDFCIYLIWGKRACLEWILVLLKYKIWKVCCAVAQY
jgi:hypothetical protein